MARKGDTKIYAMYGHLTEQGRPVGGDMTLLGYINAGSARHALIQAHVQYPTLATTHVRRDYEAERN